MFCVQGISYKTLEEMLIDLQQDYIDGILLDVLSANNLNSSVLHEATYGVTKAFDISFSYGIGLSGDAVKLETLFNEYINKNPVTLDVKRKKNWTKTEDLATDEVRVICKPVSRHRSRVENLIKTR